MQVGRLVEAIAEPQLHLIARMDLDHRPRGTPVVGEQLRRATGNRSGCGLGHQVDSGLAIGRPDQSGFNGLGLAGTAPILAEESR